MVERRARRRPDRQGERRRRLRRRCSSARCSSCSRRRRASSSGTSTRRPRSTACATIRAIRFARSCRATTSSSPTAAAIRWCTRTTRFGARDVRADLQRARSRRRTIRCRAEPRFAADLGFLGNRLPDREARVEEFFLRAAAALPDRRFLLGGNGWDDKPMPANVRYVGHVYTADHNAFNCTPDGGAERQPRQHGALRLLAGDARLRGRRRRRLPDHRRLGGHRALPRAGSRDPGRRATAPRWRRTSRRSTSRGARAIGAAARRRVLAEHTYAHRAASSRRCSKAGTALALAEGVHDAPSARWRARAEAR